MYDPLKVNEYIRCHISFLYDSAILDMVVK